MTSITFSDHKENVDNFVYISYITFILITSTKQGML